MLEGEGPVQRSSMLSLPAMACRRRALSRRVRVMGPTWSFVGSFLPLC